jgi:polar amino acid transport system substrate-binding protein
MIENGEAWGTFPYGYQEKLAQNFDYSDPVIKGHHHFYYLTQNRQLAEAAQNFTTISDFKNYTFGGTNGYWYGDKSTIESQGVKTEWASDTDALIKMLYAGRIDFFIEDEQVADAAIARLFPNDSGAFAKLPAVASYRDYYLVISRSYPHAAEIKNKFNVALKKLTDNGTINRILTENGISGN